MSSINRIFKILVLTMVALVISPGFQLAQDRMFHPNNVIQSLKEAGANRLHLENVIRYFKQTGDIQKLKAAYFLIGNMDIHSASSYYWIDKNGAKLPFNELNFRSFDEATQAFQQLKNQHPGLRPKAEQLNDLENISSQFLIDNIDLAFSAWRAMEHPVSFELFCEYILPYRIENEPLQTWRKIYLNKYAWEQSKLKQFGLQQFLPIVAADCNNWFLNIYSKENRGEPLLRLGAIQLLFRKKGLCEDIADLTVFGLRSQGIPSTVDIVPYWATSSGGHTQNVAFENDGREVHYDITRYPVVNLPLSREPGKVIRITYSKQIGTLGSMVAKSQIPPGFLRLCNYIDVTKQYWEVANVECVLSDHSKPGELTFACILNGLTWHPIWWAKSLKNKVIFTAMSKGAVYLPMVYKNDHLVPAGYPTAEGYKHSLVLSPNWSKLRSVTLENEEKYLKLKLGEPYRLYYWDHQWKMIGEKTAKINQTLITFENVPQNALLLLISKQGEGKERPFIITDSGNRVFF